MPLDALTGFAARAWWGGVLRSGVAIAVPSLAVLDDDLPAVGILLYLIEVLTSAILLYGQTGVAHLLARRAVATDGAVPHDRASLQQARAHAGMVVGIGLICAPFLWVAALIGSRGHAWQDVLAQVVERGGWLVLCIMVSGVIDTVLAPVRSPAWLRTMATYQLTRVWLLHPVILFGFLLYALTGSLLGMLGLFVGGRLLMDINALRHALRPGARLRPTHGLGRAE